MTGDATPLLTRRRALALGLGAVVVAGTACSDSSNDSDGTSASPTTEPEPSTTERESTTTEPRGTQPAGSHQGTDTRRRLTGADFAGVGACAVTPEQTSGPYYLDGELPRRDITEDRPGSPLRLGLRVEDEACRPVVDARVDVWHADADGDYSAFVDGSADDDLGEGTTFLRGTQISDGEGIVDFDTIFPGWYPGRAVHVHVMVYLGSNRVLTSQMYFADDLIADIYASAPYRDRGLPDTPTRADSIAGDPAKQGLEMSVSGDETGRLALLRLSVGA